MFHVYRLTISVSTYIFLNRGWIVEVGIATSKREEQPLNPVKNAAISKDVTKLQ